jgi:hypothetical protein
MVQTFRILGDTRVRKPFMTRQVNTDDLRTVVAPHIAKWRELTSEDRLALILFDGQKTHLSVVLIAWAAGNGIILDILSPHDSHLLQLLDQGFFHRLTIQCALSRAVNGVSTISAILERIWMVAQATIIARIVWKAWRKHPGIVLIISDGVCTG